MKLKEYLEKVINEEMSDPVQSFQIEFVNENNIQMLRGFVQNVPFELSLKDFTAKYPKVWEQIKSNFAAGEIIKFNYNDNPENGGIYDFVKINQNIPTKVTPDVVPTTPTTKPVYKSNLAKPLIEPNIINK